MKKSKLLILISLLLLGCNTGSLSSDNPSESLSNTSSSEEILSNEEDSSINSSTYSIDYSELKEIKCSFSYEYIDYSKTGNYYSHYGLLDKAEPYLSYNPINVKLDFNEPNFIIDGDYLKISYYGDIENIAKEAILPPPYPGYFFEIYGEIVNVEYVRRSIEIMTYEDIVKERIQFIVFDKEYSFCEISEEFKDNTFYVAKFDTGEVIDNFAYTFNPLEI